MWVPDQSLRAEIAARLRALGEDRDFDAAQMQLINLPEIIAAAGPNWARVKDALRARSVAFLEACLESDDIVLPAGEGFLLIFAQAAPNLAARAEELRGLLVEFYLSQDGLQTLGVQVAHRIISGAEIHALIAPPPPLSQEPPRHALMFAPLWSPGPAIIASYFCTPIWEDGDGPRCGYDAGFAESGENTHRDYCALDLAGLDLLEQALTRYPVDETVPALGASVHSSTMQHRHARAAYLERLGRLPRERMKHVFVRVAEIEIGAPLISLADWAGMLRARVRNIVLEFHHSEGAPPDLAHVAAWGAGYRAPLEASNEGVQLAPFARQARRWGEGLSRQGKRFFVESLRRPGMIRLAAAAGAHFITSDNFWPLQKWPGAVSDAAAPSLSPFPEPKKPLPSAAS